MKIGRWSVPMLVLLIAPFGFAAQDDAKKDLKSFQGVWSATKVETMGKAAPAELVEKITVTFEKDKMTLDGPMAAPAGGEKPEKPAFTIVLDPSNTPKTITLKFLTGPKKGKSISGIYSVGKDELKLCLPNDDGDASPAEFKTTEDSKSVLLIFKRMKK